MHKCKILLVPRVTCTTSSPARDTGYHRSTFFVSETFLREKKNTAFIRIQGHSLADDEAGLLEEFIVLVECYQLGLDLRRSEISPFHSKD